METPTISSTSNINRGRRKLSSSPFLRKPVPRMGTEKSDDDADGYSNGKLSHVKKHSKQQSYDAVSTVDTDDPRETIERQGSSVSHGVGTGSLERHLSLLDLIAVGIGGTVGSGLFVLAGLVAHEYAGPATVVSWIISGFTACLSGCCYAELSGRIPLPGGAYAYNYVAMGELCAVVTAACLSLEYIAASAAVSRSWGDKCLVWLTEEWHSSHWLVASLDVESSFNPLAFLLSTSIVLLLLAGVKESKAATNFFTVLKLLVVSTTVFGALYYVQPKNWVPFAPFGMGGAVRGATGTFFGYLGYDQVTALAGEANNAKYNLPRAILGVLSLVMLLYCSATLFLTGMQPYQDISPVSGFPHAFRSVGANYLAEFVSLGEIVTLPIVILVTIMAQPRLQYAMAMDGLLPRMFGEVDQSGNLFNGTLVAGGLMTLVATFLPFERLNDMISCSVLAVLALTDTSVVLLWHEGPSTNPNLPGKLMFSFHVYALVTGVTVSNFYDSPTGKGVLLLSVGAMVYTCLAVYRWCPRASVFGGYHTHYHEEQLRKDDGYFTTPFVPLLPCLAVCVNWYLIAQLDLVGIGALLFFLILSVAYYFLYAAQHSVGNNGGWEVNSPDRDTDKSIEMNISNSDLSILAEGTNLTI